MWWYWGVSGWNWYVEGEIEVKRRDYWEYEERVCHWTLKYWDELQATNSLKLEEDQGKRLKL